jgi:hypothetical protein
VKSIGRFLGAGLLVVVGCTQPPAPPTPRTAQTQVQASFSKTWNAVIDDFAANNIPIHTIDRSSGIIATDLLNVGPGMSDVADCGSDMGIHLTPTQVSYNVLVRGDTTSSSVRVTVRWVRVGPARGLSTATVSEDCSTKQVWEQRFETRVKAAAEASRGS